MKKIGLYMLMVLVAQAGFSQGTTNMSKGKLRFSSINQAGLLSGAAGQAATLQSINGVQKDNWFTGVGIGLHYYGMRSIPLFVDVRKAFGQKPNRPFVYADAGVHLPWETQVQLQRKGYEKSDSKGLYCDAGVGYALTGIHKRSILLSAGYSYKKMTHHSPGYSIWPWPGTPTFETYTNQYRTIVVKVGVQL